MNNNFLLSILFYLLVFSPTTKGIFNNPVYAQTFDSRIQITNRQQESGNHEGLGIPRISAGKIHREKRLKIGLALGGGAAKGLAHIGVLKALEEAGIQIDYIAGSSMGALVGAAYAAGIPIDTLEQIALETDWKDVAMLFDPTLPAPGIINGQRVSKFLQSIYGSRLIEELSIPFVATAANIISGKKYIISQGDLVTAVRTSISIPVVFTPLKYGNQYLVDGGLIDPVPIKDVRSMGADYIIAVNVLVPPGDPWEHRKKSTINADSIHAINKESWLPFGRNGKNHDSNRPGLIQIMHKTITISQARLAQLQIELERPDILIEPPTSDIKAWDFQQGKKAIKIGYDMARKVIAAHPELTGAVHPE